MANVDGGDVLLTRDTTTGLPQYVCPTHGTHDRVVTFSIEGQADEVFCMSCLLALLREHLAPVELE